MSHKNGLRLQLVTTEGILIETWDLDDVSLQERVYVNDEVTAEANTVATYMPGEGWFLKPEYRS